MKKTRVLLLAVAGLLASGAANAQFYGTFGYSGVNPKSGNGTLAGADANVNDDGPGEVPHGAAQDVVKAAQQHRREDAGAVVRLLVGERAGGLGVRKVDDVQTARRLGVVTVAGQRGTPGDQALGVAVHEGPVVAAQAHLEAEGPGAVAAVHEILHGRSG